MQQFNLYLKRRGKAFYFRLAVPLYLQPILRRSEICKSLRTSDHRQAQRSAIKLAERYQQVFEQVRLGMDLKKLREAAANGLGFELDAVEKDEHGRPRLINPRTDGTIEDARALAIYTQAVLGLSPEMISPSQAPAQAPQAAINTTAPPVHSGAVQSHPDAQKPISHFRNDFFLYKTVDDERPWGRIVAADMQRRFDLLVELLADMPVGSVTPDHARTYYKKLVRLPQSPDQILSGARMSAVIDEVYRLQRDGQYVEILNESTVGKYRTCAKQFFEWLSSKDNANVIPSDPFAGIKLEYPAPRSKAKAKRKQSGHFRTGYSDEQIAALFATPPYVDHKFLYPYCYFVPLIGIYSALRLNEICQLHLSDITTVDGVPVFDVNDYEPHITNKSIKSDSSAREIPIHSKLIELGFLDYVKEQRQAQQNNKYARLFPELEWTGPKSTYAKNAGNYFNANLKKAARVILPDGTIEKIPNGKGYDFHTFRSHLAQTLFFVHKVDELTVKAILGHHEDGDGRSVLRGNYLTASKLTMKQFQELFELVDFSPLMPHVKPYYSQLSMISRSEIIKKGIRRKKEQSE